MRTRKQKYQLFETFEMYLAVEMYELFFIYFSSAFFFLQIFLQNISFVTCIMIYNMFIYMPQKL